MKLERKHQKIFADSATDSQLGKIGSAAAGSPERTRDIEEMQELAEYERGYFDIVSSDLDARLPYSEDLNSLLHISTRQLAYLMQAGVAEWDSKTHYYSHKSIVQYQGLLCQAISGDDENPNVGVVPFSYIISSDSTLKQIIDPKWKLLETAFPIGFDYIRFPDKPDPNTLGLSGVWENTSNELNGAFIRFEGANAEGFGSFQSESLGRHNHYLVLNQSVNSGYDLDEGNSLVQARTGGSYSYSLRGSYGQPSISVSGYAGSTETRPKNYTVQKWTRVS